MRVKWEMAGFRGSRPFIFFAVFFMLAVSLLAVPAREARAESVKIAIDPGHGGMNFGAQHRGFTEKDMNLAVAQAMAEELRKYEGIEVFLTRTDDRELSLQQRADYAKEAGADFLFCLHFNMSENHALYGTEVWVSAFGKYYARGKSFGELCLDELCALGLYRRGVKTRLEDGADYYGIIKHAKENGIPAAIIEHCHLDNAQDEGRYETAEALRELGRRDATAVAKYYGLYSPSLEADYRKHGRPKVEVPDAAVKPDDTEPVNVSLTCLRTKAESGEVNILLTGEDPESGLLYYDYSLDGGKTYSGLKKWEAGGSELECTLSVPVDQDIALKCRVYNGYDLDAETGTVEIPALQGWTREETVSQGGGKEEGSVSQGGAKEEAEAVSQGEADTLQGAKGPQAFDAAHQIDMGLYEKMDGEAEKQAADGSAMSQFLWVMILGLLLSLLLFLTAAQAVYRKKQKRAGRRGRWR